jgi:hypothetical protein
MADTGVSYKTAVSFFRGKISIFIQQNYPALFTHFSPPFAAAQLSHEKITSDESQASSRL